MSTSLVGILGVNTGLGLRESKAGLGLIALVLRLGLRLSKLGEGLERGLHSGLGLKSERDEGKGDGENEDEVCALVWRVEDL